MKWTTPERMFVCVNRHSDSYTQSMGGTYNKGQSPASDVSAIRDRHLPYRYALAEKGITWAAGALSGEGAEGYPFALCLYSVNSLEEAKQAQENDPYTIAGMSVPVEYFEWYIHMPISRAMRSHRAMLEKGLAEAGVKVARRKGAAEWSTPPRLFVCLSKQTEVHRQRLVQEYDNGIRLTDQQESWRYEHLRYVYELGEKGIMWAGGPSADYTKSVSIFAVSSFEEAKKAKQNDPYYIRGLYSDDKYYEWNIHMPLDRASPGHRERLEKDLKRLGVI